MGPTSHTKIWVKCLDCNEEFERIRRDLYKKHTCQIHRVVGGKVFKYCNGCRCFIIGEDFPKGYSDKWNLSHICKKCTKIRDESSTDLYIRNYLRLKKSLCKTKQKYEFDLDLDHLKYLWHQQRGRCWYTDKIMSTSKGRLESASLDRVDSNQGYVKGNVVWCTKAINVLKGDSTIEDVRNFFRTFRFRETSLREGKLKGDI